MPKVKAYDVLTKTGRAAISGNYYDVCLDSDCRTAILVAEYTEEQLVVHDQEAEFCEQPGRLSVVDEEGVRRDIDCYKLVKLSMEDL